MRCRPSSRRAALPQPRALALQNWARRGDRLIERGRSECSRTGSTCSAPARLSSAPRSTGTGTSNPAAAGRSSTSRASPSPTPMTPTSRSPGSSRASSTFRSLAAAFRLTDDAGYLDELGAQLRVWIDANPVEFGVNWACTMDVAIRGVNWVAALVGSCAGSAGAIWPARRTRTGWKQSSASLLLHGRFIRGAPRVRERARESLPVRRRGPADRRVGCSPARDDGPALDRSGPPASWARSCAPGPS